MKKMFCVGAILLVLFLSVAASAAETKCVNICDQRFRVVVEAKLENDLFSPADTFDSSDNVYVWGYNVGTTADVYVTIDRNWKDGDAITPYVLKKSSADLEQKFVSLGKFGPGRYDVVVDRNKNGVYDKNCDGVDSATILGFEVLPELSTLGLLGMGLASMTGYFSLKRKK